MKELLILFITFVKIGAVSFGGGYAMLPLLERELNEKRKWVNDEQLSEYFAIGQCTPGIIAVNVATFIGRTRKGIPGALAAVFGFIFIPFFLILAITALLTNFADNIYVQRALSGVRIAVCVLVLNAVIGLIKKNVKSAASITLFIIIFIVSAGSYFLPYEISPAILVLAAAAAGIIIKEIGRRKK